MRFMAEDIQIWEIAENQLNVITKAKLDLEKRLEDWIEQDISILSNDLLVIGRQVNTDFRGIIDLLCLDYNGDVIIVELKRDKTPREITAQVLDYASWVADLSNDKITELSNAYFKELGPLEERFKIKFGNQLPEILNEHHSIIIVASEIDSSSERIIRYLSDNYGVGINAATFQYFKNKDGYELLARVFLIDPSEVEHKTRTKTTSKRKPTLTYDELQTAAEENGVGDLYKKFVKDINGIFDGSNTTRSSIAFVGTMNGSRNTIFSLLPKESNSDDGLKFQIYINRLSEYIGANVEDLKDLLPEKKEIWAYCGYTSPDWSGYTGYFSDSKEVDKFLTELRKYKNKE